MYNKDGGKAETGDAAVKMSKRSNALLYLKSRLTYPKDHRPTRSTRTFGIAPARATADIVAAGAGAGTR